MSETSTRVPIEDEYVWTFFGPQAEYYLERWRLRQQGRRLTFNLAAFLAGLFWFAYRRMYLVFFCLLGFLLVESMAEEAVFGEPSTASTIAANLLFGSLYGFLGNNLYLWHAERKIRRLLALGLPKDELLVRLRRAGGTSWVPVLVMLALLVLFIGLYFWLGQTTQG
ncbi:DUF2628 domain-containing protein [Hymenobacter weizhouensis]|uniref:DUF2628 domain-containing protein n=1 Tax=Hymenobacter sp. YIM 151500-1 TaxID=2987689 RepID=UPI0022272B07|nr:DUF2628 domain-containing protein [Hymenobacter sp. YIM 151500-1]UYZ63744.1 DUF2628 domain-containing protein [Hymenobacter sp. YIM 151500-1]